MAEKIETLKLKDDPNTEVYPNIKKENIPTGAVDTTKISFHLYEHVWRFTLFGHEDSNYFTLTAYSLSATMSIAQLKAILLQQVHSLIVGLWNDEVITDIESGTYILTTNSRYEINLEDSDFDSERFDRIIF